MPKFFASGGEMMEWKTALKDAVIFGLTLCVENDVQRR